MEPNPKGVMEKNNRTALEIDRHNRGLHSKDNSELKAIKSKVAKGKAKQSWETAKKVTKGVHQLGLKDEPRHKTLSGKEVKY